jgi:hypothetical protein
LAELLKTGMNYERTNSIIAEINFKPCDSSACRYSNFTVYKQWFFSSSLNNSNYTSNDISFRILGVFGITIQKNLFWIFGGDYPNYAHI